MERIIRLAIEGGWKKSDHIHLEKLSLPFSKDEYCTRSFLMDPEFYKALGRQQRWGRDEKAIEILRQDIKIENMDYEICMEFPTETEQFYNALGRQREKITDMNERLRMLEISNGWQYHKARALASYDDGGSAEEYLNSVIK